jgi:hypothetical protein
LQERNEGSIIKLATNYTIGRSHLAICGLIIKKTLKLQPVTLQVEGDHMENVRNNFRVSLKHHLLGKTTDNEALCVSDFGAGGMGFQTKKVIEIDEVLSIAINALEQQFVMVGQIVRKSIDNDLIRYGFKSLLNDQETVPWVKLVNDMNMLQRKQPTRLKYVACNCNKEG